LLKLEAFKIAVDCEIKLLLESFAKGSAVNSEQPYRIAPPDILLIDSIGLERSDPKISDGDTLAIEVSGTPEDQPITGRFKVGPKGRLALGPRYGTVSVAGLDYDTAAVKIRTHLERIIREPDVSLSLAESRPLQQISGEHLVGPDGRVTLGVYGTVPLEGLTLEEARAVVEDHLQKRGYTATVAVDVLSYNSHVYYVVVERSGENTFVHRSPVTGNDRVLDALTKMDGSLAPSSKVQLHRPKADGTEEVLDVDWQAIVQGKSQATNYQLKSGDRLFVKEAGAKGDGLKR
jgi:polysaccharide export outer membrane protein